MSLKQNDNYEEAKHEFFLEGKDPLEILTQLQATAEGNEKDEKNTPEEDR